MRFNIVLFLTLLLSLPLRAMIGPASLDRADYQLHFTTTKEMVPDILAAINETPEGGLIALNGSHVSHAGIIDALKLAQERGVRVETCVDVRKKDNKILLEKLNHDGLHATNNLHTKRCIIFDVDPRHNPENIAKARVAKVFTGSENLSNQADKNLDYTFVTANKDIVTQHYEDHLFNKSLCAQYKEVESDQKEYHRAKIEHNTKETVLLSPRFTRIYNSQKFDSSRLKEARIAKPVPEDLNETLYVSTMGWDDIRITHALCAKLAAKSKVTILTHIDAVKSSKGLPQLKKLHEAGAKIYVWMKESPIQHTKLLLRERRNKIDDHYAESLAVLSTGNLVENSRLEINYDQIIPESHAVSQDIRRYFDDMMTICTPFEKVDLKKIIEKKAAKGKENFTLTCGLCRNSLGASSEESLIKKLILHGIQQHQYLIVDTVNIENTQLKKVYCGCCPECSEPRYNLSESQLKYKIGLHLGEKHRKSKEEVKAFKKNMIAILVSVSIAAKNPENK